MQFRLKLYLTVPFATSGMLELTIKVCLGRWLYSVADDFFTKQLPHNVTWGLTVLYALDASKDLTNLAVQASLFLPVPLNRLSTSYPVYVTVFLQLTLSS